MNMRIAKYLGLLIISFLLLESCRADRRSIAEKRDEMIRTQLEQRGIDDKRVIEAFRTVPREEFTLPRYRDRAYDDIEVSFGFGETLDRPYEDALLLKSLALKPADRILEIGTGSGYLSAVVSRIVKEVYTIEIVPEIADFARKQIENLGYKNIHFKTGDGFLGWLEYAPFDAIVLSCSPAEVPEPLIGQLAEGGRLILPIGGTKKFQDIVLFKKKAGKFFEVEHLTPATFSPMKGKIQGEK